MSTIPAQQIVSVVPSVLAAGGSGLVGIGMMLTSNSRVPIGSVVSFSSAAGVSSYFGPASVEAAEAAIYFSGFSIATIFPANLLFYQFNTTAVPAYLRGGNISNITLAQLQVISGTLNVTIDGYAHNAASINLSSASSFSNAASLIQTAINGSLSSAASVTGSIAAGTFAVTGSIAGNILTVTSVTSGTIEIGAAITGTGVTASTTISNQISGTAGGIGTYAVNNAQIVASTTINGTYGILTVTAVSSGALAVGQTLSGTGVTANTIITQLGTGTGANGTYFVNFTQTASSTTITANPTNATVTFDSTSGAFVITSGIVGTASTIAYATGTASGPLLLTSATGAVTSQGAAAVTPSIALNALITNNVGWVNYMTLFDPDGGSGNTQKQLFAAWKNTALGGNRFGYFVWDPDLTPQTSNNAASSLGRILKGNNDSGTLLIWEGSVTADNGLCAFALGWAASINYNQTNGRAVLAFKSQPGLVANVTDPTTASNLAANGYNFYGAYGSATSVFVWEQNGQITGPYAWADSFQTEVWLNTFFQAQLLSLMQNSLSIPFTTAGVTLVQQACQTVIQAGLSFGAFAPNTLTASQIAQVNSQAGGNIAGILQAQGWYLQVDLPSQIIQVARGPWPITFWYIDRNSVQQINLSSVLIP